MPLAIDELINYLDSVYCQIAADPGANVPTESRLVCMTLGEALSRWIVACERLLIGRRRSRRGAFGASFPMLAVVRAGGTNPAALVEADDVITW